MRTTARVILKRAAQGVFLAAAVPAAALAGFGRARALYTLFAQASAGVPGIPGVYLRGAFYRLTLRECAADVTIGFGSYFAHPEARVAENVSVGAYCVMGRARIGERTQIASHVQILSGRRQHERDEAGRMVEGTFEDITVGADCWIGAAAIVMADVGTGSTIGAGAVVTRPVPAGAVAVGNPARVLSGGEAAGGAG